MEITYLEAEMSESVTYPRNASLTTAKIVKTRRSMCYRCGGSGIFRPFGTCFRCGGERVDPTAWDKELQFPVSWTDEQCAAHVAKMNDRKVARRAKAEAKKAAEAEAVWAVNVETFPLLATITDEELADMWTVAADIVRKARQFPLSEKQVALVIKVVNEYRAEIAAEAERVATATPAPTGKAIQVEGEVVMSKWYDGQFPVYKMMVVTEAGWKVFTTVPSALGSVDRGERVRFVADLEATDDVQFVKGSRPRKAERVDEEDRYNVEPNPARYPHGED